MSADSASLPLPRPTPGAGTRSLAARHDTRPRRRLRSHRWITLWSVLGSLAVTALMSALLNDGAVRTDMLITSAVCALIMDPLVGRITRHYRRRLAASNAALERRVLERTADLAAANASLRDAAAAQLALRDELLLRDRLATVGMLAAGVNHELRSPLTVITLGVEELERLVGADASAELQTVLTDVRTASEQTAVVVGDLSSLASPAGGAIVPIALGPVVASAIRLARYQLRSGVDVTLGPITDTPIVGNASRLIQVVLNLVVNAIRATRAGVPNRVVISAEARGERVELRIADRGRGMSDETRGRLFQPFFTTGADQGGTGLGLSICKALVEAMDGTITVQSELDVGTQVVVTLRAAAAPR